MSQQYKSETPAVIPTVVDHDKYRLHTYQAGVGVPFSQALISGLCVGALFLVMAWLFGAMDAWKWGIGAAALTVTGIWFYNERHWLNLTKLEEITGIELDGKLGIGEPEVTRIDLTTRADGGRKTQFLEIPCSPEDFRRLAVGIIQRRMPFSETAWTGKGKPFSQKGFQKLRSYLIVKGLVTVANSKNKLAGYVFTRDGVDMLKDYLPHPSEEDDEN